MDVYAVVTDIGGAYNTDGELCVYSLWTTEENARREVLRLKSEDIDWDGRPKHGPGHFYVKPITMDQSSDTWIT